MEGGGGAFENVIPIKEQRISAFAASRSTGRCYRSDGVFPRSYLDRTFGIICLQTLIAKGLEPDLSLINPELVPDCLIGQNKGTVPFEPMTPNWSRSATIRRHTYPQIEGPGAMPLFRAFTPFCAGAQMSQCEGQILYGPFEPIPKPPEALPSPSSSESGRSRDNPHNPSSLRAPRTGAQDPTHTLGVPHDPRSPWDRSGAR